VSAIVSPGLAPATAYRQMAQIRATEERFFELYAQGLMSGTVHTSIGQEACAVGVVNALDRSKDVIFSNHRAHGHYLAYADDVEGLVAELLGRATGVVGGIGGTQHLHIGNLYTNGIQGGIAPNAVGAALAEKLRGADAIVAVFLGDGTMGQGTVYESLNLAALWSLPLLFVLEDNQYAQSTHKRLEHAGDLSARPAAFGIPVTVIEATASRRSLPPPRQRSLMCAASAALSFWRSTPIALRPIPKGTTTAARTKSPRIGPTIRWPPRPPG
jgi:TPP-dependent pyruvate/acetoin dehydrogenase alpha subunit